MMQVQPSGVFAQWQPAYAEAGISTFPVRARDKKPAVSGYLNLGLDGSRKLAGRFQGADALGFALGPKSGITVLDIDTEDEQILGDALSHHGATPIVVRSGSGNWQAWYKNSGEGRRIRPWPDRPIDLLGDGYVIAPPSKVTNGQYAFVEGGHHLPVIRNLEQFDGPADFTAKDARHHLGIPEGLRNKELWRHSMRQARYCDDIDGLLDVAMTYNDQHCIPALDPAEVIRTAESAWAYQKKGENWFGSAGVVSVPLPLLDQFEPDETHLYLLLKKAHAGRRENFAIGLNSLSQSLGWGKHRLMRARNGLIAKQAIELVRQGGLGGQRLASSYRFVARN